MTAPPYVSYSQLQIAKKCMYLYKLKYVTKEMVFAGNIYTTFGSALHSACEKKMVDDSVDAEKEFDVEFFNNLKTLPEKTLNDIKDNDIIKFRESGKNILPHVIPALKKHFEGMEVIDVEEELFEPIDGFEKDFKGFIDLIIKTPDGQYHIIDYKTTSYWDARKRSDAMTIYQLMLYKLFFSRKHDIPLDKISTHFVLLSRTNKKNPVEVLPITSGNKRMQNAEEMMHKHLKNIISEKYFKNLTSCTYCDGKEICAALKMSRLTK